MKKYIVISLLLLIASISTIYFLLNKNKTDNELTLYGNVEIRTVDLGFQVGGRLEKLFKEEGDDIKKGELIALIDNRDYKANLEDAAAKVKQTNALKTESNTKFQRNSNLITVGAISKQDYDTSKNLNDKANADYDSAVAYKKTAQNQLNYTKLYAPDDGIIITRVQEEGSIVNKGQIIYTMAKNKPVWIRAYIKENDLGNIKYGQKVKVLTDTINPKTNKKREYEGQIGYISPVAEFTPKTVQSDDLRTNLVYRIRVYVDNIDEYLRQGMPTTIKINLASEV